MSYRATNESSTMTAAERGAEARKIMDMGLAEECFRMAPSEQQFVERLANDMEIATPEVSIKQLWWLRDLKDRYLG